MAITEKDLCDFIRLSAREVCKLGGFSEWLKNETPNPGDLILINNSYIYRDKVKTKKSPHYLALLVKDGGMDKAELVVATGTQINSTFRRFRVNSQLPKINTLEDGCRQELFTLHRLVFTLIGKLDDSEDFSQKIDHSMFNRLVFRSNSDKDIEIDGKTIITKIINDEERIWNELNALAVKQGLVQDGLPENVLQPFMKSVKELRESCYVNLIIPQPHLPYAQSFLDRIVDALKTCTYEYRESLEKWSSGSYEPQEYTNILRIAYNFADEAVKILRLLISVCDLKPVLLWMTIKEQIELADAFTNLPWAKTNSKPSFAEYVKLIGGARNRAFHHLLPFEHTLMVQLDGVKIQAKSLRLFPEYSSTKSKNRDALDYEGKELVEVLTEFTRTDQRSVSPTFWQRNLDVMIATINLLTATSSALKLLNDIE